MTQDDPFLVDRHDLDALKELMQSEFRAVDRTLQAMQEALHVAANERSKKDAELNEVRLRFVDRITFEQFKDAQSKALDAALLASSARITPLENFRAKATGAAVVLALFAGAIGAAIAKIIGG
jgi:hypothetical protein